MIRARCVWSRGRRELVLGVQVMVRGCLSLTSRAPALSISSCFYRVASAITGFASSQSSLSSIPHHLLSSLLWEGQYTLFLWQTTISEFCTRFSTFPLWTWFIISDTFIKTNKQKNTIKTKQAALPPQPPPPHTKQNNRWKTYCYPTMSLMLWRSLEMLVCLLNCLSYLLWSEKGLLLFECDRSVQTVATTIYNYWFQCDIKGPKFSHYSLQLSQTKVNNSWVWTEGIKERLPTKISMLFLSETQVSLGTGSLCFC